MAKKPILNQARAEKIIKNTDFSKLKGPKPATSVDQIKAERLAKSDSIKRNQYRAKIKKMDGKPTVKADYAPKQNYGNAGSVKAPSASGRAGGMINTDMKNYAQANKAARNAKMIRDAASGVKMGLRGGAIGVGIGTLGAAMSIAKDQGSKMPTTTGQMGRKRK